jgi:hypothetical protein
MRRLWERRHVSRLDAAWQKMGKVDRLCSKHGLFTSSFALPRAIQFSVEWLTRCRRNNTAF